MKKNWFFKIGAIVVVLFSTLVCFTGCNKTENSAIINDTNVSSDKDSGSNRDYSWYSIDKNGNLIAQFAWEGSFNGSGTKEDPYRIESEVDLARMSLLVNTAEHNNNNKLTHNTRYRSAYYRLENDIDIGANYWVPIGIPGNLFTGHFDGNGHVISNMIIKNESLRFYSQPGNFTSWGNYYQYRIHGGLFGCINTETSIDNINNYSSVKDYPTCVEKLWLNNVVIDVDDGAYNQKDTNDGRRLDEINYGYDNAGFSHIGGIVGHLRNGIIDSCRVTNFKIYNTCGSNLETVNNWSVVYIPPTTNGGATVIRSESLRIMQYHFGGVVGYANSSIVTNCSTGINAVDLGYGKGNNAGRNDFIFFGGIVGMGSASTIEGCYSVFNCIAKIEYNINAGLGGIMGMEHLNSIIFNCASVFRDSWLYGTYNTKNYFKKMFTSHFNEYVKNLTNEIQNLLKTNFEENNDKDNKFDLICVSKSLYVSKVDMSSGMEILPAVKGNKSYLGYYYKDSLSALEWEYNALNLNGEQLETLGADDQFTSGMINSAESSNTPTSSGSYYFLHTDKDKGFPDIGKFGVAWNTFVKNSTLDDMKIAYSKNVSEDNIWVYNSELEGKKIRNTNAVYSYTIQTCFIPKYTITYHYDSGESDIEKKTLYYGQSFPDIEGITKLTEKSGYVLEGYYTGKNGQGTMYYNKTSFIGNNIIDKDIDLYACWTAEEANYTFTIKDNYFSNSTPRFSNGGKSYTGKYTKNKSYSLPTVLGITDNTNNEEWYFIPSKSNDTVYLNKTFKAKYENGTEFVLTKKNISTVSVYASESGYGEFLNFNGFISWINKNKTTYTYLESFAYKAKTNSNGKIYALDITYDRGKVDKQTGCLFLPKVKRDGYTFASYTVDSPTNWYDGCKVKSINDNVDSLIINEKTSYSLNIINSSTITGKWDKGGSIDQVVKLPKEYTETVSLEVTYTNTSKLDTQQLKIDCIGNYSTGITKTLETIYPTKGVYKFTITYTWYYIDVTHNNSDGSSVKEKYKEFGEIKNIKIDDIILTKGSKGTENIIYPTIPNGEWSALKTTIVHQNYQISFDFYDGVNTHTRKTVKYDLPVQFKTEANIQDKIEKEISLDPTPTETKERVYYYSPITYKLCTDSEGTEQKGILTGLTKYVVISEIVYTKVKRTYISGYTEVIETHKENVVGQELPEYGIEVDKVFMPMQGGGGYLDIYKDSVCELLGRSSSLVDELKLKFVEEDNIANPNYPYGSGLDNDPIYLTVIIYPYPEKDEVITITKEETVDVKLLLYSGEMRGGVFVSDRLTYKSGYRTFNRTVPAKLTFTIIETTTNGVVTSRTYTESVKIDSSYNYKEQSWWKDLDLGYMVPNEIGKVNAFTPTDKENLYYYKVLKEGEITRTLDEYGYTYDYYYYGVISYTYPEVSKELAFPITITEKYIDNYGNVLKSNQTTSSQTYNVTAKLKTSSSLNFTVNYFHGNFDEKSLIDDSVDILGYKFISSEVKRLTSKTYFISTDKYDDGNDANICSDYKGRTFKTWVWVGGKFTEKSSDDGVRVPLEYEVVYTFESVANANFTLCANDGTDDFTNLVINKGGSAKLQWPSTAQPLTKDGYKLIGWCKEKKDPIVVPELKEDSQVIYTVVSPFDDNLYYVDDIFADGAEIVFDGDVSVEYKLHAVWAQKEINIELTCNTDNLYYYEYDEYGTYDPSKTFRDYGTATITLTLELISKSSTKFYYIVNKDTVKYENSTGYIGFRKNYKFIEWKEVEEKRVLHDYNVNSNRFDDGLDGSKRKISYNGVLGNPFRKFIEGECEIPIVTDRYYDGVFEEEAKLNITYYAKNSGGESVSEQIYNYGKLAKNTFTNGDMVFVGWSLVDAEYAPSNSYTFMESFNINDIDNNASKYIIIQDGATVSFTDASQSLKLYALWTTGEVELTFIVEHRFVRENGVDECYSLDSTVSVKFSVRFEATWSPPMNVLYNPHNVASSFDESNIPEDKYDFENCILNSWNGVSPTKYTTEYQVYDNTFENTDSKVNIDKLKLVNGRDYIGNALIDTDYENYSGKGYTLTCLYIYQAKESEIKNATINFHSNTGSIAETTKSQKLVSGEGGTSLKSIGELNFKNDGYTFLGWVDASRYNLAVDFSNYANFTYVGNISNFTNGCIINDQSKIDNVDDNLIDFLKEKKLTDLYAIWIKSSETVNLEFTTLYTYYYDNTQVSQETKTISITCTITTSEDANGTVGVFNPESLTATYSNPAYPEASYNLQLPTHFNFRQWNETEKVDADYKISTNLWGTVAGPNANYTSYTFNADEGVKIANSIRYDAVVEQDDYCTITYNTNYPANYKVYTNETDIISTVGPLYKGDSVEDISKLLVPGNASTIKGYNFVGWSMNKDASIRSTTTEFDAKNINIIAGEMLVGANATLTGFDNNGEYTLYAIWNIIEDTDVVVKATVGIEYRYQDESGTRIDVGVCTVTFNVNLKQNQLNGKYYVHPNVDFAYDQQSRTYIDPPKPTAPKKKGYTFKSWEEANSLSKFKITTQSFPGWSKDFVKSLKFEMNWQTLTNISDIFDEERTGFDKGIEIYLYREYTPKYTKDPINITFNSNDENNKTDSQTVKYTDSEFKLKHVGFTRDGYKFIGWTNKENANKMKELTDVSNIALSDTFNDELKFSSINALSSYADIDIANCTESDYELYAIWQLTSKTGWMSSQIIGIYWFVDHNNLDNRFANRYLYAFVEYTIKLKSGSKDEYVITYGDVKYGVNQDTLTDEPNFETPDTLPTPSPNHHLESDAWTLRNASIRRKFVYENTSLNIVENVGSNEYFEQYDYIIKEVEDDKCSIVFNSNYSNGMANKNETQENVYVGSNLITPAFEQTGYTLFGWVKEEFKDTVLNIAEMNSYTKTDFTKSYFGENATFSIINVNGKVNSFAKDTEYTLYAVWLPNSQSVDIKFKTTYNFEVDTTNTSYSRLNLPTLNKTYETESTIKVIITTDVNGEIVITYQEPQYNVAKYDMEIPAHFALGEWQDGITSGGKYVFSADTLGGKPAGFYDDYAQYIGSSDNGKNIITMFSFKTKLTESNHYKIRYNSNYPNGVKNYYPAVDDYVIYYTNEGTTLDTFENCKFSSVSGYEFMGWSLYEKEAIVGNFNLAISNVFAYNLLENQVAEDGALISGSNNNVDKEYVLYAVWHKLDDEEVNAEINLTVYYEYYDENGKLINTDRENNVTITVRLMKDLSTNKYYLVQTNPYKVSYDDFTQEKVPEKRGYTGKWVYAEDVYYYKASINQFIDGPDVTIKSYSINGENIKDLRTISNLFDLTKDDNGVEIKYLQKYTVEYTKNPINITYFANYQGGGQETQSEVNVNDTLRKNTFTRDGYKFVGWTNKENASKMQEMISLEGYSFIDSLADNENVAVDYSTSIISDEATVGICVENEYALYAVWQVSSVEGELETSITADYYIFDRDLQEYERYLDSKGVQIQKRITAYISYRIQLIENTLDKYEVVYLTVKYGDNRSDNVSFNHPDLPEAKANYKMVSTNWEEKEIKNLEHIYYKNLVDSLIKSSVEVDEGYELNTLYEFKVEQEENPYFYLTYHSNYPDFDEMYQSSIGPQKVYAGNLPDATFTLNGYTLYGWVRENISGKLSNISLINIGVYKTVNFSSKYFYETDESIINLNAEIEDEINKGASYDLYAVWVKTEETVELKFNMTYKFTFDDDGIEKTDTFNSQEEQWKEYQTSVQATITLLDIKTKVCSITYDLSTLKYYFEDIPAYRPILSNNHFSINESNPWTLKTNAQRFYLLKTDKYYTTISFNDGIDAGVCAEYINENHVDTGIAIDIEREYVANIVEQDYATFEIYANYPKDVESNNVYETGKIYFGETLPTFESCGFANINGYTFVGWFRNNSLNKLQGALTKTTTNKFSPYLMSINSNTVLLDGAEIESVENKRVYQIYGVWVKAEDEETVIKVKVSINQIYRVDGEVRYTLNDGYNIIALYVIQDSVTNKYTINKILNLSSKIYDGYQLLGEPFIASSLEEWVDEIQKTGYRFTGWKETQIEKTLFYATQGLFKDGASPFSLIYTLGADALEPLFEENGGDSGFEIIKDIYYDAEFEKEEFTIHFNSNYQNEDKVDQTIDQVLYAEDNLSKNTFALENYEFVGWSLTNSSKLLTKSSIEIVNNVFENGVLNTTSNNKTIVFSDEAKLGEYGANKELTLYAVWIWNGLKDVDSKNYLEVKFTIVNEFYIDENTPYQDKQGNNITTNELASIKVKITRDEDYKYSASDYLVEYSSGLYYPYTNPKMDNFTFNSWEKLTEIQDTYFISTNKFGNGQVAVPGYGDFADINAIFAMDNGITVIITKKWKANFIEDDYCYVNYHTNNGNDEIVTSKKLYVGSKLETVSALNAENGNKFTLSNHIFKGWYINDSLRSINFLDIQTSTIFNDVHYNTNYLILDGASVEKTFANNQTYDLYASYLIDASVSSKSVKLQLTNEFYIKDSNGNYTKLEETTNSYITFNFALKLVDEIGTYSIEYKLDSIKYGDMISPSIIPTKENYTFSNWAEIFGSDGIVKAVYRVSINNFGDIPIADGYGCEDYLSFRFTSDDGISLTAVRKYYAEFTENPKSKMIYHTNKSNSDIRYEEYLYSNTLKDGTNNIYMLENKRLTTYSMIVNNRQDFLYEGYKFLGWSVNAMSALESEFDKATVDVFTDENYHQGNLVYVDNASVETFEKDAEYHLYAVWAKEINNTIRLYNNGGELYEKGSVSSKEFVDISLQNNNAELKYALVLSNINNITLEEFDKLLDTTNLRKYNLYSNNHNVVGYFVKDNNNNYYSSASKGKENDWKTTSQITLLSLDYSLYYLCYVKVENLSLYPVWNNQTLIFDKGNDLATGNMPNQTLTFAVSNKDGEEFNSSYVEETLNSNKFALTGYDFVGWYYERVDTASYDWISSNGVNQYNGLITSFVNDNNQKYLLDASSVVALSGGVGSANTQITVYAVWAKQNAITIYGNDGDVYQNGVKVNSAVVNTNYFHTFSLSDIKVLSKNASPAPEGVSLSRRGNTVSYFYITDGDVYYSYQDNVWTSSPSVVPVNNDADLSSIGKDVSVYPVWDLANFSLTIKSTLSSKTAYADIIDTDKYVISWRNSSNNGYQSMINKLTNNYSGTDIRVIKAPEEIGYSLTALFAYNSDNKLIHIDLSNVVDGWNYDLLDNVVYAVYTPNLYRVKVNANLPYKTAVLSIKDYGSFNNNLSSKGSARYEYDLNTVEYENHLNTLSFKDNYYIYIVNNSNVVYGANGIYRLLTEKPADWGTSNKYYEFDIENSQYNLITDAKVFESGIFFELFANGTNKSTFTLPTFGVSMYQQDFFYNISNGLLNIIDLDKNNGLSAEEKNSLALENMAELNETNVWSYSLYGTEDTSIQEKDGYSLTISWYRDSYKLDVNTLYKNYNTDKGYVLVVSHDISGSNRAWAIYNANGKQYVMSFDYDKISSNLNIWNLINTYYGTNASANDYETATKLLTTLTNDSNEIRLYAGDIVNILVVDQSLDNTSNNFIGYKFVSNLVEINGMSISANQGLEIDLGNCLVDGNTEKQFSISNGDLIKLTATIEEINYSVYIKTANGSIKRVLNGDSYTNSSMFVESIHKDDVLELEYLPNLGYEIENWINLNEFGKEKLLNTENSISLTIDTMFLKEILYTSNKVSNITLNGKTFKFSGYTTDNIDSSYYLDNVNNHQSFGKITANSKAIEFKVNVRLYDVNTNMFVDNGYELNAETQNASIIKAFENNNKNFFTLSIDNTYSVIFNELKNGYYNYKNTNYAVLGMYINPIGSSERQFVNSFNSPVEALSTDRLTFDYNLLSNTINYISQTAVAPKDRVLDFYFEVAKGVELNVDASQDTTKYEVRKFMVNGIVLAKGENNAETLVCDTYKGYIGQKVSFAVSADKKYYNGINILAKTSNAYNDEEIYIKIDSSYEYVIKNNTTLEIQFVPNIFTAEMDIDFDGTIYSVDNLKDIKNGDGKELLSFCSLMNMANSTEYHYGDSIRICVMFNGNLDEQYEKYLLINNQIYQLTHSDNIDATYNYYYDYTFDNVDAMITLILKTKSSKVIINSTLVNENVAVVYGKVASSSEAGVITTINDGSKPLNAEFDLSSGQKLYLYINPNFGYELSSEENVLNNSNVYTIVTEKISSGAYSGYQKLVLFESGSAIGEYEENKSGIYTLKFVKKSIEFKFNYVVEGEENENAGKDYSASSVVLNEEFEINAGEDNPNFQEGDSAKYKFDKYTFAKTNAIINDNKAVANESVISVDENGNLYVVINVNYTKMYLLEVRTSGDVPGLIDYNLSNTETNEKLVSKEYYDKNINISMLASSQDTMHYVLSLKESFNNIDISSKALMFTNKGSISKFNYEFVLDSAKHFEIIIESETYSISQNITLTDPAGVYADENAINYNDYVNISVNSNIKYGSLFELSFTIKDNDNFAFLTNSQDGRSGIFITNNGETIDISSYLTSVYDETTKSITYTLSTDKFITCKGDISIELRFVAKYSLDISTDVSLRV